MLGLINLLRHLDSHDVPAAQFGAFAALTAVLATEAVLVVRQRPWGALRWPAVAVVLAASALSYLTLPDGKTSTTVDWLFGAANWVGRRRPARPSIQDSAGCSWWRTSCSRWRTCCCSTR